MKKIMLGLFLILVTLSFASPNFVDVNKIKQNSYENLLMKLGYL